MTLHRIDPELAKGYAPILREEMKQQRAMQNQQALGQFYNQQLGGGHPQAMGPIENPMQLPLPGQQQALPQAQAQMPNVDFTQLSPDIQKLVGDVTMKQKQLTSEEERAARTESKDYRKEVMDNYKKGIFTQARLNRIEQLGKSKNLPSPLQAKLVQFLGLPEGVMSGDAQELQKLSTDLMSGVTDAYRGRILEYEVKNYAHTIPNLMQTKEGRQRVIDNMLLLKDPAALEYKTMKDIIKENGGKPPFNLQEQVTEQMEGYLEKFKDDFGRQDKGTVAVAKDGQIYNIPKDKVQQALAEGFMLNE